MVTTTTPPHPQVRLEPPDDNRSLTDLDHLSITAGTTVGMLPNRRYQVDSNCDTSQIDQTLRQKPDLPGVVIKNSGHYGVISRRKFYEMLGRRYGVAIYLKRPIAFMQTALRTDTMVVDQGLTIAAAVGLALARPPDDIYEPLLIEYQPHDYRLLDIYTLLLAQSRLFASLQQQLQEINTELERRVANRTTELLTANQQLEQEIRERQRAEILLETRLLYEETLKKCANVLLVGGDTQGVINTTISYLIEAADVSSVFLYENLEIEGFGPSLRLRNQTNALMIPAIHQKLQIIPHSQFGDWAQQLAQGQRVIGQFNQTCETEKTLMQALGFVSALLLPVGIAGNWSGLIGFGETYRLRNWDENDIQLLETVAQMIYTYLERRRNAQLVAQARDEALRASQFKSELLAKVSHELRTPLGAILGYAQLLSFGSYGSLSTEQQEATELVIGSTKYLATLVNGLLDQAQLESGQLSLHPSWVQIKDVLGEVEARIRVLADNKKLAFHVRLDSDLPGQIYVDGMRLQQVLINLLGNAIKFTDQGWVQLQIKLPTANRITFAITDTGIGIPEDAQTSVFDPFSQADGSPTRRFSGTGLGLSISKQLVEMMGGQIRLLSKLGVGSTFTVELPVGEPDTSAASGTSQDKH
ncbi:MAG: hypothetical protein JW862_08330 [Anaerolineales bacterium]|nr:hypothetical protein [Anaerolineales bacterium]